MADVRSAAGVEQPTMQALLRLLKGGNCWVKLSAGYHHPDQDPPYPETMPLVHALVAARPDRLFWGTDWPHAAHPGRMPNSTELFDLLLDWVPDERTRTHPGRNPAGFTVSVRPTRLCGEHHGERKQIKLGLIGL
jgi:predicted TIM-barrel fold metal-dependent hydrolase